MMAKRHSRNVRGFLKDRNSGATMIEFALIAPVFFLVFMGIIELGLMFFTYTVLEGAVARGARVGMTGYKQGNRENYIAKQIEKMGGSFLDPGRMRVEILAYNSFANIGEPEPCLTAACGGGDAGIDFSDVNGNGSWDADQGRAGAGTTNDIVHYKVTYTWDTFTPMMGYILGSSRYPLVTYATVKNEAFE